MYEDFMKLAQESLKPVMKLAENNTALAVKLMQAQSENAAELMQNNLAHVKALVETKDLNVAVEMQHRGRFPSGSTLGCASLDLSRKLPKRLTGPADYKKKESKSG